MYLKCQSFVDSLFSEISSLLCLYRRIMSDKDLFSFGNVKEMFDVPSIQGTEQTEECSESFIDVFEGINFDSPAELSSPSETESNHSEAPKKPLWRRLVIGKHIKRNEVLDGAPKFTCTICNCSFSRKDNIRYHDYCVTGKRPLKCNLCDKRFVKKSHLIYHVRTHTGESPYSCSICQKKFKQKSKLNRHARTHNRSVESGLVCPVCMKSYSDKDSLKKHVQKHSLSNLHCSVCKKIFQDKLTLKQHMENHKNPRFICDVCGKTFMKMNNLNVHKLTHEDVYPFICEECHKTFRSKKDLIQHGVVHKDGPGFECNLCSITCGRKDNLLRHIRNCHLDPCDKKSRDQVEVKSLGKEDLSKPVESKGKEVDCQLKTTNKNLKKVTKESKKKCEHVVKSKAGLTDKKKAVKKKSEKAKPSKKLRPIKPHKDNTLSESTGKDDTNLLSDSSLTLDLSPPSLGVLENMTSKYSNLLISSGILEKKSDKFQNSVKLFSEKIDISIKNSEVEIKGSRKSLRLCVSNKLGPSNNAKSTVQNLFKDSTLDDLVSSKLIRPRSSTKELSYNSLSENISSLCVSNKSCWLQNNLSSKKSCEDLACDFTSENASETSKVESQKNHENHSEALSGQHLLHSSYPEKVIHQDQEYGSVSGKSCEQNQLHCSEPEKTPDQVRPKQSIKTSVIVHTSAFKSLVPDENASREPVIKFSSVIAEKCSVQQI